MRAGIGRIGAPLRLPDAGGVEPVKAGQLRGRAVHHRGVDHLALAGFLRLDDAREHAERQIERPAAEIADHAERDRRRLALAAHGVERAGQRDVVQVVARGIGERALLAPAGDAAVDEARIAREARVGPEPEALGDAGAKTFDQRVGALDELQHELDGFGPLQVELDRAAAAQQEVVFARPLQPEIGRRLSLDADDGRAELGEQHRAHRARPDAGQLDDFGARQRSHDDGARPSGRAASAAGLRAGFGFAGFAAGLGPRSCRAGLPAPAHSPGRESRR